MSNCKVLKDIQERIRSGEDPETVIPYDIECADEDDYIELLHYAAQVLPDGYRKDFIKERIQEYARR